MVMVLLEMMELPIEYEPATVRIDYLSDLNIYCLSFESDDDTYHHHHHHPPATPFTQKSLFPHSIDYFFFFF